MACLGTSAVALPYIFRNKIMWLSRSFFFSFFLSKPFFFLKHFKNVWKLTRCKRMCVCLHWDPDLPDVVCVIKTSSTYLSEQSINKLKSDLLRDTSVKVFRLVHTRFDNFQEKHQFMLLQDVIFFSHSFFLFVCFFVQSLTY